MLELVKQKKFIFNGYFFFLVILVVGSLLLGQQSARGYGYGTCTAEAPIDLAVVSPKHSRRLQFSWEAVTFADCTTAAVDHYRFQVRLNNSTLIQSDDDVSQPSKSILLSTLLRNHVYKFRVRAVASDGSITAWSDYKLFRTTPKPPQHLTVRTVSTHQAYASWSNVMRSESLRYYQVVVYRNTKVVYRKKVRVGLRKRTLGVTLRHLRVGADYTLKVRAVANQETYSKYTTEKFTQELH